MVSLKSKLGVTLLALVLCAMAVAATGPATAQVLNCLPTCSATDGRFLAISGSNLINLSENKLNLTISVPAGTTTFQLGIFDGDAGALDLLNVSHWDTGVLAFYEYTLYADPAANGTGTTVVNMAPGSPSISSSAMPDNAWATFNIPTSPNAQAPSGHYFYRLNIQLLNPSLTTTNAFKVRSDALISGTTINPVAQPFSYIANLRGLADIQIIYPNYPNAVPTNYDGTFSFYFDIPVTQQELMVWDGDFDRGRFDGADLDTDDPDTPNAPFRPSWATPSAVSEGVAVGAAGTTGNPPDDRNPAGSGIYNSKPPSVLYEVIFPNGQAFLNTNPSGNSEWEQFRISTDPFDPAADYYAESIPPGIYQFKGIGVDMQNLNALLLPSRVLCVSEAGVPCLPLRPFLIGDTVFSDANGDGVQDPDEPGIANVIVELLDHTGAVIATTTTDADGHYSFGVEAGSYTVRISADNFIGEIGGVLVGYENTTPETCFANITNDNEEDCDFGYQGRGSIGNRVWYDANANGVQDAGEPGLNGVLVDLVDGNGDVLETQTTDGDGNYQFLNVDPGTYTVRVDMFTLANGAVPTYDLDGVATPHETLVTLASAQHRMDVDFGYVGNAAIGDRVWNDVDADGVQDAGEAGINGVTVYLYDIYIGDVVATTVTSGDGNYSFPGIFESTYQVQINTGTLPAGYTQTYDLDGLGTPDYVELSVFSGETRNDVDFGYRDANAATGSIGDRVWNDANGNGVQDAGEAGINGATVELLDAGNNVVATTATAGDGNYTFPNLAAGTYTVRVVAGTLPAGVAPTFDADGIGTPNVATVSLGSGENTTTVDFGYRGTASVGDRVWYDGNGDGVQDAGETGINGVTVELLDAASNVVATTTTAGDGNYTFSFLMGGNYSVRVVAASLPPGVAQTYDLDGIGTPHVASFALAGGQNRTDVDFGYRGTGSVGDRLWLDTNGNGVQDAGEAGINGATVQLFDGGGALIATTSTAGDGVYGFTNLGAGTYTVRIVPSTLPAGVEATYDLDGVATLNEATFTLGASASRDDVDFGYRGTASVGDRVWNDTDGDGAQDAGETGINGVTVELLDSTSTVIATTATSGDGDYTFSYLLGGSYSVRVVSSTLPAGLAPTYDLDGIGTAHVASFTLNAGQNRTDVDFGYRGTASIGDRVWNDADGDGTQDAGEAGINGVTVELLDGANNVIATTTTSGDGNYTFSNLSAGTYTVRVTAPAGTAPTYDLDGVGTANTATLTLAAGDNRTDVDFGYRGTASIGDRVWNDADGDGTQDAGEAGINGVTVELLDGANNVIATTTTSGDGNYTFSNLSAGTYTVRVTAPAGTAPTYDLDGVGTANTATLTLNAGDNRTDVDFGYRGTASIGDRVWNDADGDGTQDAGEAGINGVTVELLDNANNVIATTTTAGDGNYTFSNLNAGTYVVRVTPPAGTAPTYDLDGVGTANTATLTLNAGDNRTDVDFGYRGTASIGDRVWNDADGDGTQDAGEAGINGVTVELLDNANNVIATTTTSGDGNYTFSNLNAGTYTVRVTPPAGTAPTYDLDGVATANVATVTLAAGANRTDVDFGYRATASIGDRVWSDLDGDGVQEAGEAGINGVTVELLDAANNVIATTTTSGDGNYTFSGLASGTYTVRVVSATIPDGFTQTYDLDGVASANQATVILGTTNRTDVDFGYRPNGDCVVKADLQPELGAGIGGHDFWMPGLAEDLIFTPAPGGFTVNPDGTARLTGTLRSAANPGNAFTVDVQFSGFTTTPPAGNPKKEFAASAYIENGGPIDPSGWWYYTAFTGTLTGTGNYAGAVIDIVKTGPAFQVGVGANNKNGNYGFSGWFNWTVTQQPASGNLQATGQGDINSDLVDCPPATASVGDRVWNDADGDGVQDAGEAGINGVTVELLDTYGNVIATTTTSGDGNYGFANLLAGNYSVRVTAPAGLAPTYDLDGVATANIASFSLAAGQTRTDVDFGYRGTASVGDRVWNDADGDGVQDAGEAGINGVTVQLLDSANTVIATTTTSGDGNYTFGNLSAGSYSVRVTPPAGVAQTYDLDGVASANIASFSLTAGQTRTDVDFGYRGTASVGDRVWNDADGDGVQDAGEAGINGVTVQLLDSANNVIATTTTAGNGTYTFSNLSAGSYSVRVTPPAGVAQTYDLDGVATANIASFSLAAGQTRTDVDFGYRGTASVGDRVWNDTDGDGVQDAGEAGINGVTVQLLDSANNVIATATTAGDGNYTFSNLSAGSYSVRVTPPAGVAQTYDLDGVGTANVAAFTLTAGQTRTDVDFGYRGTASVGDRVWNDADGDGVQDAGETGINGVTVQLLNSGGTVIATTTTSGDGTYTFGNLSAGSYSVRVTAPAGFAQTYDLDGVGTANIAAFTLTAGQARTDVDFGYRGNLSVGDRVWNDADGDGIQDATETGLNGVTVQLLNSGGTVIGTATTSGNGNYTFTNLAPGNYSVRVVSGSLPAGYTQTFDLDGVATAHTASFSLAASRTDVDFGYKAPACTAGTFKDTFTNASFSNNEGTLSWSGSWIEVDSAGAGVSSGNVRVGTPVSGYMILNDYPDTGTQPSAARQMNLTGFSSATVTVDYHIRGVEADDAVVIEVSKDGGATYTVLETITGRTGNLVDSETYDISAYISSNTRIRFRISANYGGSDDFFKVDQVRVDAGCAPNATYSVGDRVWSDADGDGVQDSGEAGIGNVTVQLVNSSNAVIATDVTDSNGVYGFTNLAAGSYTVRVVSSSLPSGYTQTYDLDGIATAHQATFSLSASRTDVDFGYKPPVACAAGTFKDTFTTASFSNNEGTRTWAGSWIENDTAGVGVSSGNVTVGTPVSGYMILRDSPDTGTQPSAARQMNLTGFAGATLTVSFHIRGVETSDAAVIEVSKDGGATYTVLETLTGYSGTYISSRTYDISAYIASNTRIRFRISANYGGDDDFFKIDQVQVSATCTPPTPVTYSVGDRVWKDTDGDGVQDSGETGIANVTVQLLNSGGTVIATDVTDADGIYGFTNLAAGTYSVRVVSSTLPSGYTPTYDLDGVATPHIVTGPLTENHSDVDFGYKPPAASCTASGTFKDTFTSASFSNNEGTLSWSGSWIESDTAGAGVSSGNVTVGTPVSGYMVLRDSPDTGTQPSAARQMNLTGFASATLTVNYHIRGAETDDAAVIEVSKDGGASYTVLETFTGLTGDSTGTRTYNITSYIASNTRIRFRISANYGASGDYFKVDQVQVSASCTPPAATYSVGDLVWKDLDRDGVFDSGEPGIGDVTVQLLNSGGTVIATDITDSNGIYGFSNLAAGTYTVKVVSGTLPSGLTPSYDLDGVSSAHQATFSLSANRTDVDFGYKSQFANPGTGTIGYWKNHPEAWPVESITLGNQTYTKAQAIALLGRSSAGDKSIDLAKQLIAAGLNVLIGNDWTCVASTIIAADNWLKQYPVGSGVSGSSSAWQTGSPLHTTLDDYNNGELCAPHRD